VIVSGIPTGGHGTRTIVFRGDTLYLSVGSSCNICNESNARRAAVTSYRPDGSGEQIYASGLRNSVGLAVHPGTGEIWATNNDRDNLGDDIPPDRVNILQRNGFYGWPNCYLPGRPNPEYSSNQAPCANAVGPAVELQAHAAPLGLTFYQGTAFPQQFRGALFIAEHGSWNRSAKVGYRVAWVPVQNGRPAGEARRFVSGWLEGQSNWGRPVDVLSIGDGSLLISDDQNGRIYRVSYQGG
jgi:glucose/arabinose dehydrogenase